MNYRHLCVFDLETTSPDADTCQIVQIAAQILDNRRLTVLDTFNSWVQPNWNEDGILDDTLQWHADLRAQTKEEFIDFLNNQPTIDTVWPKFTNWVDQYNKSGGNVTGYNAPIPAGYNIVGFDIPIVNRYCLRYGPTTKDKRTKKDYPRLFSSVYHFDLMQHMFFWTENIDDPEVKTKLKLAENVKVWMGFPEERINAAHNAYEDVVDTTKIIQRIFGLQRFLTNKKAVELEDGTIITKRALEMKNSFKK